ncbi:MAG: NAD-dependent epimerase/dehydratase family protein [Actinomycetota bacterium]|nr:NAD-dependent epimerase/dehydratase family protein [Actinomycetota bacterium]
MRCLVTGAAGFIGSHLCRRLVADGWEVVGLDDLSEGDLQRLSSCPEVEFVGGNLLDEQFVSRAAARCDVIFHQGAIRSVERSMIAPGSVTDVNVRGTLNVLMAAKEHGARVVSASSSSIYGDQERFPLSETMSPRPRSPYAASKLAGEAYCTTWWKAFGVPTVSLRYFNVFGPEQDPSNQYAVVVPKFIVACLTGSRPLVHGDGEQARDFTYIDSVLDANLLAAEADEDAFGRAFNIGGGEDPTSVKQLLQMVAALSDAHPDPIYAPPREGDVRRTHADIAEARRVLGYEPGRSFASGLQQTVEWFSAHYRARAA